MTSLPSDPPHVQPAPPERWVEALDLAFAGLSAAERSDQAEGLLAEAHRGSASLAGLLEARRGPTLVGAVFSQVQVGRTAVLWPPQLAADEPSSTAGALLEATCGWLTRQRVQAVHTLLAASTDDEEVVLAAAGFRHLADLLYLVSEGDCFPTARPAEPLEFEPYSPEQHARFAKLVEATYEGTLDCPGLDGVRSMEDVLAGYRATGRFSPSRWLFVRHNGRDVGCLLLADHPAQDHWELVYMGLVPQSRGHGWGLEVTRYGQWLARQAGRPRLVLAVDTANQPAVRAYAMAGFRAWDRRRVYLKVLAGCGRS